MLTHPIRWFARSNLGRTSQMHEHGTVSNELASSLPIDSSELTSSLQFSFILADASEFGVEHVNART